MSATDTIVEWFGSQLEKAIVDSLKSAVDESTDQILADTDSTVPFLTGHLKSTGFKKDARVVKNEVVGEVTYGARYARIVEYKRMWMRKALIKNAHTSLAYFEGKLKR